MITSRRLTSRRVYKSRIGDWLLALACNERPRPSASFRHEACRSRGRILDDGFHKHSSVVPTPASADGRGE